MTQDRAATHPNRATTGAPLADPERTARDIARVAANTRTRLHSLGVEVNESDTPEDLVIILEAIERFENVIRGLGGDLMMDEPPPGSRPQPDGENRSLPQRAKREPAQLYVERLERAAERVSVGPE